MRRKMTMALAAMLALGMLAGPAAASQPSITDIAVGDGTFDHAYDWWDPTGICGDEPRNQ